MRLVFWMAALVALVACAAKPLEEKSVPVNPLSSAPGAASATVPGNPAGAAAARGVAMALGATASDAPLRAKPAIGDFGLDLGARNPRVKPGDDFFAYANGGWYDSFNIPEDKSSFGPFDRLDELSKERVRGIIERAAAAHAARGTPEQQIGDYYAAYMDRRQSRPTGSPPPSPICSASPRLARGQTSRACLASRDLPRCSMYSCRRTSRTRTAIPSSSASPPSGFPIATTI